VFRKTIFFYGEELVAARTTFKAGNPPLVGCPRLLIQYIRSYPPYLEAVSSVCNLRMQQSESDFKMCASRWFWCRI